MPTYDYLCNDCGHEFEIFQGMLEKKLTTCPSCGGNVRRLIGAGAGIVFKGSGFYQTDYRSSDYRKRAKDERKASTTDAAPAKSTEEGSGEKKPAAGKATPSAKSSQPGARGSGSDSTSSG